MNEAIESYSVLAYPEASCEHQYLYGIQRVLLERILEDNLAIGAGHQAAAAA